MSVVVFETMYIGLLGVEPLAAMALVVPFVVLMGMMSIGAMGGGVSSAVARALGANNHDKASAVVLHAGIIALCGGIIFTATMMLFGRELFSLLGGAGKVLDLAVEYSQVLFAGAISVWLTNTFVSVLRGTGAMKVASATLVFVAVGQIIVGGCLGLGLLGLPRWGLKGVACGLVVSYTTAVIILVWYLLGGRSRLSVTLHGVQFDRGIFVDILKVGGVACFSSLQSVATVVIFTRLLAPFGTVCLAGYGIGTRLEFVLAPIAGSIGTASIPIVGMNVGAGNIGRARRVTWCAGVIAFCMSGTVGLLFAIFPTLWAERFTAEPAVIAAASEYLSLAGPTFGFLGLGMAMYFASQGSGKILAAVLAQSGRLLTVIVGGLLLLHLNAPATAMFGLVATSLFVYGSLIAASVYFVSWEPRSSIGQVASTSGA